MPTAVSPHPPATLAVLHPVFALTGVLHAVGGALLPSLAARFHLSDADLRSSVPSLFCRNLDWALCSAEARLRAHHDNRLRRDGCTCLAVAASARALFLQPVFLASRYQRRRSHVRCHALHGPHISRALRTSAHIPQLLLERRSSRCATHCRAHSRSSRLPSGIHSLCAPRPQSAAIACGLGPSRSAPNSCEPQWTLRAQPRRFDSSSSLHLLHFSRSESKTPSPPGFLHTHCALADSGARPGRGIIFLLLEGFLSSRGFSSLLLLRAEPMRIFRIAIALGLRICALLWVCARRCHSAMSRCSSSAQHWRLPIRSFSPAFSPARVTPPTLAGSSSQPVSAARSSLDRRFHLGSYRQPPRRHAHHSRGAAAHGDPSARPSRLKRQPKNCLIRPRSQARRREPFCGSPLFSL